MKRIALPRIRLEDLGDARLEEKAQQLEAKAQKLLRKDPAFSLERALKLDKADFREEIRRAGGGGGPGKASGPRPSLRNSWL